jgi:hypothetical protein
VGVGRGTSHGKKDIFRGQGEKAGAEARNIKVMAIIFSFFFISIH